MRGCASLDFGHWTLDFGLRPLDFGLLNVACIRQKAKQSEEGAEHVLAFRSPSDRFDVERMQGKQGGDEGAAPSGAGGADKQQEQQHCVGAMEEDVCEVMRSEEHTSEL